jgi:drug/metabolite transporter superfamily protein YnfA
MRFFICLPTGFAAKKFAMRKTCFAAGSLGLFPTPGEGDFLRSGVFFGVGAVGRRAGPARAALFSAVTFAAFFAAAAVLRGGGAFRLRLTNPNRRLFRLPNKLLLILYHVLLTSRKGVRFGGRFGFRRHGVVAAFEAFLLLLLFFFAAARRSPGCIHLRLGSKK